MCKIYADVEGKGKEGEVGAEGRTLVVGIPESLVAAVTALQFRPRYILGKVPRQALTRTLLRLLLPSQLGSK